MKWQALVMAVLCSSSAFAADDFEGYAFYLGDPHAHTGVSGDGGSADLGDCKGTCGNLADVFEIAKDNGLDWVAIAEHANGSPRPMADAAEYADLLEAVLEANDPAGGFITLPAAEVWLKKAGGSAFGHTTLLMFADDADLEPLSLSDLQPNGTYSIEVANCDAIETWMDRLTESWGNALIIPHHPATLVPMATDWTCHSDTYQPAVEIYSRHGLSLSDDDDYDVVWGTAKSAGMVEYALDPDGPALRMGFMGGTDSHDTNPGGTCSTDSMMPNHPYGGGLTVVMLDSDTDYTREAIREAIIERKTYATSGPLVPAVLEFRSGGALLGTMGDELGVPEGQDLDIELHLPDEWVDAVEAVTIVTPIVGGDDDDDDDDDEREKYGAGGIGHELVAQGDGVWKATVSADDMPNYLFVKVALDGNEIYGEDGCDDAGDDDREWLWLSPSWIEVAEPDLDGDGVAFLDGDCDDGDATVGPGAVEIWYDGIDQDCDDNDDDQDGDGYGIHDDCDDSDAEVSPSASEVWYDGFDQDCDGNDDDQDCDGYGIDDDCDDIDALISPAVSEVWYDGIDQNCDGNDDDQDGDGVPIDEDCNDTDADVSPEAVEVWYDGVDQDCDGNDGDQDGDSYLFGPDCNDEDASVHPGVAEVWYDGVDQDCDNNDTDQDYDGVPFMTDCDDEDPSISPFAKEIWYDGVDQDCDGNDLDQDRDGVPIGADCDDTDPRISPRLREIWYDGVDQDCDGNDQDQDGDHYDWRYDCNDRDAKQHPGAVEIWYDGIDQNCDGNDLDQDRDGVDHLEDCDDTDAAIGPAVAEIWYDGIDQNCDGNDDDQDGDGFPVDEDCADLDAAVHPVASEIWYDGIDQDCDGNDDDQDGDGFPVGEDCDDLDPDHSPDTPEIWYDGTDQNCDGNDDDRDGDGYGVDEDCADGDPNTHPGAIDYPGDWLDQDCDGADAKPEQANLAAGCSSAPTPVAPIFVVVLAAGALVGRRRRAA